MRFLYIDLPSGAAGDMLLASLVDCGFPLDMLATALKKLPIEPIEITTEKTIRNGITGIRLTPHCAHSHEYRHLKDILDSIRHADVDQNVFEHCEKVLNHLAEAEAKVHGISKEKVHFHEIGALDTIVDILGFCMAIKYFSVEKILFSTLTDGYGTVSVAHGTMPVPVPATAAMIEGFRVKTVPIATELLTPTGAALLTALGEQCCEGGCEGVVIASGYGCGSKVFSDHPNFLRTTLYDSDVGSTSALSDQVIVCESDMDHISGEVMGDTVLKLFECGALDVCWIPIFMKKGRPGYRLSVIVAEENADTIIDTIIVQTRTLGVRVQKVNRVTAIRSTTTTTLSGFTCKEKKCSYKGYSFSKPEYESLVILSKAKGCSILDCMEEYIRKKGELFIGNRE